MFSNAAIGRSQRGQRERGEITDRSCGHRAMQTLRNEPTHAPMTNAKSMLRPGRSRAKLVEEDAGSDGDVQRLDALRSSGSDDEVAARVARHDAESPAPSFPTASARRRGAIARSSWRAVGVGTPQRDAAVVEEQSSSSHVQWSAGWRK